MSIPRFFLFLGLALILLPTSLEAANSTPTYVAVATLPPELLPAPPIENGPEWKEEVAGILATQQRLRSDDYLGNLRIEQEMRLELITNLLGSAFTADRLPKTYTLLNRVFTDTRLITEADKKFWHTRRPYVADKRVKLLIDPVDSPAYPSGHTSESRVLAEVLGLLMPDKRDLLRARSDEIARHRIEAGVHYQSDIEGGRLLAMLVMGALMRSEAFRQDLAAAQEEVSQVKP